MIKKLGKNNWQEWKEIRLEALKKSPDSFLSSFEEEDKIPDNMWAEQLENSIKFGYFINDKIVGCSGLLYLGCNAENLGAVKLYKKCGFKIYGTRPDYTKIDSKFYDDLIMMCEL